MRVDIEGEEGSTRPPAIETDLGAKIGDAETRVLELYRGRIKVGPHFYGGGHYLRVADGKGKVRMIFETDGRHVTSYRAGHEPQIEYVEGCQ